MRKTVVIICVIGIGIYFIVNTLPFLFVPKETILNKSRCDDEKKALEENFEGVVKNKFRDKKNHMWETIEYVNAFGTHLSLIFLNDASAAFDFLEPGDTLIKDGGNLEITIQRDDVIQKFRLDYGCNHESN
jgi:hypothetical protein